MSMSAAPKPPRQPLVTDAEGVVHFQANAIVAYLVEHVGLQRLHEDYKDRVSYKPDWAQLVQLVGFSMTRYSDISFIDDADRVPVQVKAGRQYWPPMQPLVLDDSEVIRFRSNPIVRYLVDQCGLTKLHALSEDEKFTQADWEQLMQLIGYSLCGYHELSFVSDESALAASKAAREILPSAGGCRDNGCEWHIGVKREKHLPPWLTQ